MSLFKSIAKLAGRVVPGVGAAMAVREGVRTARRAKKAGTALTTLPPIVKRSGGVLVRQLPGVAAGAAASAFLGRDGEPKKRRRMNPCNTKALTRALRRVESFHRVQKRVEKSMRKACPPTRRRAPSRKC